MAGRGTDIMLGGNAEYLAKSEMRRMQYTDELIAEAKEFAFDLASKLAEKQSRKSDWTGFKASMKSGMKSFLLSKTKRTPIILPIVVEIDC